MDEKKKMILERMRINSGKAIFKADLFDLEVKNDAAIWRDSLEAHVFATMTTTTGDARDKPASLLMCRIPGIFSEATGAGSSSDNAKKDTGMVEMDGRNYIQMRE